MSKLSPKKLLGLVAALVVVLVLGVFFVNTSEVSDEEIGTPPGVAIDAGYNATLSGSPYYFVTDADEDLYDDSLDTCDIEGDNEDRLENQNGWYRLVAYKDDMTVREVVFEQVELKENDPTVIFYFNAEDQVFESMPNKILRDLDGNRLPLLDLDKKLKQGEVVVVTSNREAEFCVDYSEGSPHTNVSEGWNMIARPDFDVIDYRSIWEVALAKGGNSGTDPIQFFPSGNNNFDVNSLSNKDLYWVYVGSGGVVNPGGDDEETINVLVKDEDSGDALKDAEVEIKGTSTKGTTDSDGKVALKTKEDSVALVASLTDYETKEVAVTDYSKEVVIELKTSKTNVETAAQLEVKSSPIDADKNVELGASDASKIKAFDLNEIVVDKVVVNGNTTSYEGDFSGDKLTGTLVNGSSANGHALLRVGLASGDWEEGAKYRVTMKTGAVTYTDDKVNFISDGTFDVLDPSAEEAVLSVEDVFTAPTGGTVVVGDVQSGTVKVGENVTVACGDFSLTAVVTGIEDSSQQTLNEAPKGTENIGVILKDVSKEDVKCGTDTAKSFVNTAKVVDKYIGYISSLRVRFDVAEDVRPNDLEYKLVKKSNNSDVTSTLVTSFSDSNEVLSVRRNTQWASGEYTLTLTDKELNESKTLEFEILNCGDQGDECPAGNPFVKKSSLVAEEFGYISPLRIKFDEPENVRIDDLEFFLHKIDIARTGANTGDIDYEEITNMNLPPSFNAETGIMKLYLTSQWESGDYEIQLKDTKHNETKNFGFKVLNCGEQDNPC